MDALFLYLPYIFSRAAITQLEYVNESDRPFFIPNCYLTLVYDLIAFKIIFAEKSFFCIANVVNIIIPLS